jgi:hypothetical protein
MPFIGSYNLFAFKVLKLLISNASLGILKRHHAVSGSHKLIYEPSRFFLV